MNAAADWHPSVLEAASWRLCSELVRRHPDLLILELHPGGGQYDCLSVVRPDRPTPRALVQANRAGTIHLFPAHGGGDHTTWHDYLTTADPRRFLGQIEHAVGLEAPITMPATTPTTLTWRALAQAAPAHVLGIGGLRTDNAWLDTSGPEAGGPREDLLDQLGTVDEFVDRTRSLDQQWERLRLVWYVSVGGRVELAVDAADSRVWWRDGTTHTLWSTFVASGRRLTRTVTTCLAPVLP